MRSQGIRTLKDTITKSSSGEKGSFKYQSICLGVVGSFALMLAACDKSGDLAYLPPDLNERSSLRVGEEMAQRFAHHASTDSLRVSHSERGLPTVYIRSTFVRLNPDHISLKLQMDSTSTIELEMWEATVSREIKDRIYSSLCGKMTANLAQELRVSEDVVRVEWIHMNATDSGTWVDGDLEANYHKE